MSRPSKVFGIGLSRTGTKSLSAALKRLGYSAVHYPTDRGTLKTLLTTDAHAGDFPCLRTNDSLTDITAAAYFEDLDRLYPGSKFVLTIRDETDWLDSCRRHWSKSPCELDQKSPAHQRIKMQVKALLRNRVYGTEQFEPDTFLSAYRAHNARVLKYFENRPDDLLVINIPAGDGYEKLTAFLGKPILYEAFPHIGSNSIGAM